MRKTFFAQGASLRRRHPFTVSITRRSFLVGSAAGVVAACGAASSSGGLTSSAAAPLRRSMAFANSGADPTLTLIAADGSVVEVAFGVQLDETETTRPQGVPHAAAVSKGTIVPDGGGLRAALEGRVALLEDGGLAFWDARGSEARVFTGSAVSKAYEGRTIRECDAGAVLLSDGSVDTSLLERLTGQKPKGPLATAENATLEGVRRLKGAVAFCDGGRFFTVSPRFAIPLKVREGDRVLDASVVAGTRVQLNFSHIYLADGGAVVAPFGRTFKVFEGPPDAAQIEGGDLTVAIRTKGGAIWETNVVPDALKLFRVNGIDQAVDIATSVNHGIGAALRRDGTVWAWQLDDPEGRDKPVRVAEKIRVPEPA